MEQSEQQAYILGAMFVLANRLQSLGDKLDEQLSTKQWLVIAAILKSGLEAPALTELAGMIGTSRQNLKKLLLILEKRGFVSLAPDGSDARILRVRLTGKCGEYFAGRSKREEQFMKNLFQSFGPEQTDGLYRGLALLTANISRMESQLTYEEEE